MVTPPPLGDLVKVIFRLLILELVFRYDRKPGGVRKPKGNLTSTILLQVIYFLHNSNAFVNFEMFKRPNNFLNPLYMYPCFSCKVNWAYVYIWTAWMEVINLNIFNAISYFSIFSEMDEASKANRVTVSGEFSIRKVCSI